MVSSKFSKYFLITSFPLQIIRKEIGNVNEGSNFKNKSSGFLYGGVRLFEHLALPGPGLPGPTCPLRNRQLPPHFIPPTPFPALGYW